MNIHDALAKAAEKGQQIQGGCGSCNAYQTLEELDDGIWSLVVHHDDWCPVLKAKRAGEN